MMMMICMTMTIVMMMTMLLMMMMTMRIMTINWNIYYIKKKNKKKIEKRLKWLTVTFCCFGKAIASPAKPRTTKHTVILNIVIILLNGVIYVKTLGNSLQNNAKYYPARLGRQWPYVCSLSPRVCEELNALSCIYIHGQLSKVNYIELIFDEEHDISVLYAISYVDGRLFVLDKETVVVRLLLEM